MKRRNDPIPYLPNGEIDYELIEREDMFCHFDLPKIYDSPEDISKFIESQNVNVQATKALLDWRVKKKLNITPTEDQVYFDEVFGYIYDCYRDPRESTNKKVEGWLKDYVEKELIFHGFEYFKKLAFESTCRDYLRDKKYGIRQDREPINYFKSIVVDGKEMGPFEKGENNKFIESFFIRTDKVAIQPYYSGEEAYATVDVYSDRIYIAGCDDMSWTYTPKTKKDVLDFAEYLKRGSPVWNFCYTELISRELEFTN